MEMMMIIFLLGVEGSHWNYRENSIGNAHSRGIESSQRWGRAYSIVFFTNSIVWTDRYKADAVQNVVKEPRTQHFHSGLFTVLSGVMMIDHLQFHQFHGLVDNPAIDQNSSKTSPKEKTPPPFPNYNNNERDKSFNNKKPLWSAKLISPGQWHTAHKIYFSIVKLSFCLFLNKDSNRSFNW